jgi:hypothetical protein
VCPDLAHRTVQCTREFQSELVTFGNSGKPLRYNSPDCPVCQRSNGYFAPTVVCREQLMRYSARRSQSRARRRTGQSTGPVRCTAGLSGGPDVRSSNGRTLTAGWHGRRTGQCPVRHATTASTNGSFGGWGYKYPQPPTIHWIQVLSLHTLYNFTPYTRAIAFNTRHKQEIKSSPKSGITPTKLVTRERDTCVHLSSCAWIVFLLPSFLCSTHL